MNKLEQSKTRNNILDFIIQYIKCHSYPPTTREIMSGVNLHSPSSVHSQLKILKSNGQLDYKEGESRTITVPGIEVTDRREKDGFTMRGDST